MEVLSAVSVLTYVSLLTGCSYNPRIGASAMAPTAFQSPEQDLAKIKMVTVLPFFCTEGAPSETVAASLENAFTAELRKAQPQWNVITAREVRDVVQRKNLQQGYRSLQADFGGHGAASLAASMGISPVTQKFLKELQDAVPADAFLVNSYQIQRDEHPDVIPFTGIVRTKVVETCSGSSILYYLKEQATWWHGTASEDNDHGDHVDKVARMLGSQVGKGSLRKF